MLPLLKNIGSELMG